MSKKKFKHICYFVTQIEGGIEIEIPSVNIEFTKTLNELKNKKAMEITEHTKIKDLIPEGYEFNWNRALWLEEEECISIPIREKKKEEVKDFDWYMKQYRLKSYRHIDKNNFLKASFESKIGLLKFICDDLNIPVDIYFAISYVDRHGWEHKVKRLKDICPPEFLNSIFK